MITAILFALGTILGALIGYEVGYARKTQDYCEDNDCQRARSLEIANDIADEQIAILEEEVKKLAESNRKLSITCKVFDFGTLNLIELLKVKNRALVTAISSTIDPVQNRFLLGCGETFEILREAVAKNKEE